MVAMIERYNPAIPLRTTPQSDRFDKLFRASYPTVVAIAARITADSHEAEDVAQEVFMSFIRSHSPDAAYAVGWLYTAAAHTALNVVRGRQRRAHREEAHSRATERTASVGDDPQATLDASEQRLAIRHALTRLPDRSATILVLRYSGLSYNDIASTLNVGVNQIGTLLRRAEEALRKELSDELSLTTTP